MKRFWLSFCICLCFASSAFAQVAVVQQARTDLVSAGDSLVGPCGAFKITKLVAWRLRVTGAGLLSKPNGNNCDGFAVDIVMYPDGKIVDILADSGGANNPAWQVGAPVDPTRYRPAIDPGGVTPPPPPPPPVIDYGAQITDLQTRFADLQRIVAADSTVVKALSDKLREFSDKLDGAKVLIDKLILRPTVASCSASVAGIPIHCKINNFSQ